MPLLEFWTGQEKVTNSVMSFLSLVSTILLSFFKFHPLVYRLCPSQGVKKGYLHSHLDLQMISLEIKFWLGLSSFMQSRVLQLHV